MRAFRLAVLLLLVPCIAHAARRFTVEDSIGLSSFVAPGLQFYQTTPRIAPSPDRTRYLAVTVRGDLESGRRVATFWIFEANRTPGSAGAPAGPPRALGTWASASNQDPVSRWRWSRDGQSVLFLGSDDEGVRRLMRLEAATGRVAALTPKDQDVTLFDEAGGVIAFLAHAALPESFHHAASGHGMADAVQATGDNILTLLFPHMFAVIVEERPTILWRLEGGRAAPVGGGRAEGPVELIRSKLVLSPDGRRALVTVHPPRIPKPWERYRPRHLPGFRFVADPPDSVPRVDQFTPQQYAVVDLDTGAVRTVLDSPIERSFQDLHAAWSPDGNRLALVGAFPPLPPSGGERIPACEVSVVSPSGADFACLIAQSPTTAVGRLAQLSWDSADRLRVGLPVAGVPGKVSTELFEREGGRWVRRADPARNGVVLEIVEGVERSPVVVQRGPAGKDTVVFDPNPQLAALDLGSVEMYAWRDPDGAPWTGALLRPPNYDPARRYPLVVQTHNLDRNRFLVDGPAPTGFAARALAARDMLVLQVDEPGKDQRTAREFKSGAAGYRAAVQQLEAQGRIDPAKVGIIAWSYTGDYVMQGLVEEPYRYAAATFAAASDTSYPKYLVNIDYMGTAREKMLRANVGAKPFGDGLKTWIENANGFQLHRVCTPALFQFDSPASLVHSWTAYAALRAQEKPVDLLYLRTGAHVLVKPRERLLVQGMNVDWYDFWLNGRRDPAPEKRAMYARWDGLQRAPRCGESGPQPPAAP